MSAVEIKAESYSYDTAAAATGFSVDVIKRAVRAGDLPAQLVRVDGKIVRKPVILPEDLRRWLRDGEAWSA